MGLGLLGFLLLGLVGCFGSYVFLYNRLNSLGWKRRTIKLVDKSFLLLGLVIGGGILVRERSWLIQQLTHFDQLSTATFQGMPWSLKSLGIFGTAVSIGFGIPWLRDRPIFGRDRLRGVTTRRTLLDVRKALGRYPALTFHARSRAILPFNEILTIAVEEKSLPVPGLPLALDGLRIAHFSDLHFTGDFSTDFYRLACQPIAEWKPDCVMLTGDIIDKEACIPWLTEGLSPLNELPHRYYVLGNHDKRVRDPTRIRQTMDSMGWVGIGGKCQPIHIQGTTIAVMGSEVPWFGPRPKLPPLENPFRILLSHSPDEIDWARSQQIGLMIAGHTHGGQGRLPLLGPVLCPSRYGSRFASGEFYLEPTTMHVNRGLSGVHLMRVNCYPEISLLTLRCCVSSKDIENQVGP